MRYIRGRSHGVFLKSRCLKTSGLPGIAAAFLIISAAFSMAQAQVPGRENQSAEIESLPLSGPPYLLFNSATEALGEGDYDKAVSDVKEAIRQRPDSIQLRELLVRVLQQAGREEAARRAINEASVDPRLPAAARAEMSERGKAKIAESKKQEAVPADQKSAISIRDPAFQAADEAYKAYDRENYDLAVEKAQRAFSLAPENEDYKKLLENAQAARLLERATTNATTVSAADQAANAAYAAQRSGNLDKALSFARKAAAIEPYNDAFRLLVIDLLISQGKDDDALAATNKAIASTGRTRALLQRRGVIQAALGDNVAAQQDFTQALALPGPASTDRQIRLQLSSAALANDDPETAYGVLVPLRDDSDYSVWLARAKALTESQNYTAAATAYDTAMRRAPNARAKADIAVANLEMTADAQGKRKARAMMQDDYQNGLLSPLSQTETAYLAARLGDNQLSYDAFSTAYDQGMIRGRQLIDAAYAAKRSYHNEQAIDLLKQTIDEADAGNLVLNEQERFNIRREISDLDRQWGGNIALTYGTSGISDGFLQPPSSSGDVLQLGSEVYWRPPEIGNRNGRTIDLFLRQFTTLYDSLDGPTGTSTTQGAAGVRVKPFSDVSFILEAAKYFKIGQNSMDDFLLRAAISDGFNTDLMPGLSSWWTGQFYGEVGRYLLSNQNFASANARWGRSYRAGDIDSNFIITPYLGLAVDYNNTYANEAALGSGPGLHFRYWFNESKYKAPTSHIDLDVQYRFRLAGDGRANGVFAVLNTTF